MKNSRLRKIGVYAVALLLFLSSGSLSFAVDVDGAATADDSFSGESHFAEVADYGVFEGTQEENDSPSSETALPEGAQEENDSPSSETALPEGAQEDANFFSPEDQQKVEEHLRFLKKFKEELEFNKISYKQVLNNIKSTEYLLDAVRSSQVDLQFQIENITSLIAQTTDKLLNVIDQTIATENELIVLAKQIEISEVAIEYHKDLLSDYMRALYTQEKSYFSYDENGEIIVFPLLLSEQSVGESLKQLKYIDLLNETGQKILETLEELYFELADKRALYSEKLLDLLELKSEISAERENLEMQRDAKENLLIATKGQEEIYSQLLEQSRFEQDEALENVRLLSNAVKMIEEEIDEKGAEFNPTDYQFLMSRRSQALFDFQVRYRGLSDGSFDWPVEPSRGISAYFRDPGYAGVFGVSHQAIDLPVFQGSIVRSAADGVIYIAKDNGYGYSYIIVAHVNGLSTVYGHMSKIMVREGDIVSQGSIIGLSGGMPGTKGAGYMTTGPHLHFEVHKDGQYVDPLLYLPLEVLIEEQIDWLPEKYKKAWREAVRVSRGGPLSRFKEEGLLAEESR